MRPAPAAAASATRIATARFSRRWRPAAWLRCWPRRAARWPKAIPGRPRRPGGKPWTAIRTRPKPCSIWAIWSASAASTTSPSRITGARWCVLPAMPACSTTWGSPTKRKATPVKPRPATARCSPPPPTIPMPWPISPTSSSDAKTSPPPPKAISARLPYAPMRRHGSGSSAASHRTASMTWSAPRRASWRPHGSRPTTSRSTTTSRPTRWVSGPTPKPSDLAADARARSGNPYALSMRACAPALVYSVRTRGLVRASPRRAGSAAARRWTLHGQSVSTAGDAVRRAGPAVRSAPLGRDQGPTSAGSAPQTDDAGRGCASASSRRTCASIRWRTCRSSTGSGSIAAGSRLAPTACCRAMAARSDSVSPPPSIAMPTSAATR